MNLNVILSIQNKSRGNVPGNFRGDEGGSNIKLLTLGFIKNAFKP